ncbi:histidine kinase, partial [Streptococcus suis]
YEVQVLDIVDTMQQIRGEDRHLRLQTDNKEQEMYLISSEINQMLDAMDQSIQDIYRLQLAQKDANMRALQAQINPHFLYNTLEFFRMYAVS